MKILLLNQTFHPDLVSTAQHLSDLAVALVEEGHQVTVITSRRGYDNPDKMFPAWQIWRGIEILRIGSTRFGKKARWCRAADFASFLLNCCLRLAFLPRQDVVVALTSPPLISFLGASFARLRGGRFCYWIMDLNPDEAVAAGWLRADSVMGRILERVSRFSLRQATRIIALDRFMADRITAKTIPEAKVTIIPPWPHDDVVSFDAAGRERFRATHGLKDKFVVMYSGNHSPCHPLDTLLAAVRQLAGETFAFCFVGGGSEFQRVKDFAREHRLDNILCLPYQPLTELSASLSAADAHVVVMGGPFVGIVHPCKLYNILGIGAPVLYIGPRPSHITEVLETLPKSYLWTQVDHGKVDDLVEEIRSLRARSDQHGRQPPELLGNFFSKKLLLPKMVQEITGTARQSSRVLPKNL